MFRSKVLIVVLLSLSLIALAGCGGGSSLESAVNGSAYVAFEKTPGIPAEKGVSELGSAYTDPSPDVFLKWCMVFGQHYEYGGAEVMYTDPPGDELGLGWYMYYWLTEDGWGFVDAHVSYWPADYQVNDKKDGVPGKYAYKWEWTPVYGEPQLTELYLPIGDFDPATVGPMAIHATISQGDWELVDGEWVWNETANETGWGGYCANKYGAPVNHWEGTWNKRWGGWVTTAATYLNNVPVFTPTAIDFIGKFHPWDSWTAYWWVRFTPDEYPWPDYEGNGNDWEAWCTDPQVMYSDRNYNCTLYSCYDPNLPDYAKSDHWDVISWILNEHEDIGGIYYYPWDVTQRAIHYFKYGNGGGLPNNQVSSSTTKSYDNSQEVRDLVAAAVANGDGYLPGPGEYYAVIMWPDEWATWRYYDDYQTNFQMNIIAVDP